MDWACGACTFRNPSSAAVCSMCSTPCPALAPAPAPAPASSLLPCPLCGGSFAATDINAHAMRCMSSSGGTSDAVDTPSASGATPAPAASGGKTEELVRVSPGCGLRTTTPTRNKMKLLHLVVVLRVLRVLVRLCTRAFVRVCSFVWMCVWPVGAGCGHGTRPAAGGAARARSKLVSMHEVREPLFD